MIERSGGRDTDVYSDNAVMKDNFMQEGDAAEMREGIRTDREYATAQQSPIADKSKFKSTTTKVVSSGSGTKMQDDSLLQANRPSTEFKTKSGVKTAQAFQTTTETQEITTYGD